MRQNFDPSTKLVESLRDEIEALRSQLALAGGGEDAAHEAGAIREQLRMSEKLMAEAAMTCGGQGSLQHSARGALPSLYLCPLF